MVSFLGAARKSTQIAIGNVLGSNIFNIAFILGLTALLRPVKARKTFLSLEAPFFVGMPLVLAISSITLTKDVLDRSEAFILALLLFLFTALCVKKQKDLEGVEEHIEELKHAKMYSLPLSLLGVLGGSFLLYAGGELLVHATVRLAKFLGVPEKLIAITGVAFGTSLPELATTIVSIAKRHAEIGVGNLIGSNIFNLGMALGFTGVFFPLSIPLLPDDNSVHYIVDFTVLILTNYLGFFFLYSGRMFKRGEGIFLMLLYIAYLSLLIYSRGMY